MGSRGKRVNSRNPRSKPFVSRGRHSCRKAQSAVHTSCAFGPPARARVVKDNAKQDGSFSASTASWLLAGLLARRSPLASPARRRRHRRLLYGCFLLPEVLLVGRAVGWEAGVSVGTPTSECVLSARQVSRHCGTRWVPRMSRGQRQEEEDQEKKMGEAGLRKCSLPEVALGVVVALSPFGRC